MTNINQTSDVQAKAQEVPVTDDSKTVTANPKSTENCGRCMKGGFPVKQEILSFVTLFFIGLATILGILLINEKRETLTLVQTYQGNSESDSQEQSMAKIYEMPVAKTVKATIQLPAAKTSGTMSVEEALQIRRSKRVYSDQPVTMQELSQILWSAQGITNDLGNRTAPSARGVYPYSLYVVVRNVDGLANGLYLYDPTTNTLGDLGLADAGDLLTAAEVQDNSQKAPVVIAMAAAYARAQEKFPDNPEEVTHLEGGHIGQNIYLQAEALEMATVVTAGFDTVKVGDALGLDKNERIVYLVPFGHPGVEVPAEH